MESKPKDKFTLPLTRLFFCAPMKLRLGYYNLEGDIVGQQKKKPQYLTILELLGPFYLFES